MYFKFFKPLLLASTGALLAFASCSNENEMNEDVLATSTNVENVLSDEAFSELAKQIKTDTTVIAFTIIDPNNPDSIQTINTLKSDSRDRVNPYDYLVNLKRVHFYLHNLYGKYYSSKTYKNRKEHDTPLDRIIDVDLNRNAGGDYVYLYAQFEEDYYGRDERGWPEDAITGVYASSDKNSIIRNCSDYVRLNSTRGTEWLDCNHNTKKGGAIYLGVKRKKDFGGEPIKGIMIVAYNSPKNDYVAGGYRKETIDLNAGCGSKSDYIYIFTKK